MAPNVISTDEWGFARVIGHPRESQDRRAVKRAIRACPRAALRLDEIPHE